MSKGTTDLHHPQKVLVILKFFCNPKELEQLQKLMKKILTIVVIILISAILFSNKTYAQEVQTSSAKLSLDVQNSSSNDVRVKALKKVFENYNSPLVNEAENYVRLADKNGVDWKLLPSIAGLESSFGKRLMPNSHNAYGWGGGHIYFDSWEDGIDTITKSLSERYYARGADTVWTIGPIYAESPTWSVRVNSFMQKIESEYVSLLRDEVRMTI